MRLHSPIASQAGSLSPRQRQILTHLAFWFLFLYLELFAGTDRYLLGGVLAAGILAAVVSPLRARFSFVSLHVGILVALVGAYLTEGSPFAIIDAALLGLLVALELTNRNLALLALVAIEHAAALFLNPWCDISSAQPSPQVASHVVARCFGVALAIGVLARKWLFKGEDQSRHVSAATTPTTTPRERRPLTVAEWEAREAARGKR